MLSPFPRERRWLLPALQALQHRYGYLSTDALMEVDGGYRGRVDVRDIERLDRWFRAPSSTRDDDFSATPSPFPAATADPVGETSSGSAEATLDALIASARARRSGAPPARLL